MVKLQTEKTQRSAPVHPVTNQSQENFVHCFMIIIIITTVCRCSVHVTPTSLALTHQQISQAVKRRQLIQNRLLIESLQIVWMMCKLNALLNSMKLDNIPLSHSWLIDIIHDSNGQRSNGQHSNILERFASHRRAIVLLEPFLQGMLLICVSICCNDKLSQQFLQQ